MSRKHTTHEYDGARQVRDDARECITDLFPKARVKIHVVDFEGEVSLAAQVIGDTAPYIPADIIECLGDLGVQHVSREEL